MTGHRGKDPRSPRGTLGIVCRLEKLLSVNGSAAARVRLCTELEGNIRGFWGGDLDKEAKSSTHYRNRKDSRPNEKKKSECFDVTHVYLSKWS